MLLADGIAAPLPSSLSDTWRKAGQSTSGSVNLATTGPPRSTTLPEVGDLERRCGYDQAPGKGQYDSVLGDREKCSGTYREFIVFDDDLVYPEFIVKYRHEK